MYAINNRLEIAGEKISELEVKMKHEENREFKK